MSFIIIILTLHYDLFVLHFEHKYIWYDNTSVSQLLSKLGIHCNKHVIYALEIRVISSKFHCPEWNVFVISKTMLLIFYMLIPWEIVPSAFISAFPSEQK